MSEPALSPRRFVPQPVETITKSRRSRVAVGTIETTTKSNRANDTQVNWTAKGGIKDDQVLGSVDRTGKGRPAKNIPELVQLAIRTSRFEPAIGETKTEGSYKSNGIPHAVSRPVEATARKKFAPQLIETTKRSRRAGDVRRPADYLEGGEGDDDGPPLLPHERTQLPPHRPTRPAPQLKETTKRSHQPGDVRHPIDLSEGGKDEDDDDGPPLLPHERTQLPPPWPTRPETRMDSGDSSKRRRPIPIPPANTRVSSSIDMFPHTTPRRTTPSHAHDNTRRHSFIVPTLEPIISQPNSDESNCPSLSTSPSLSSETSSIADLWQQHVSRMRESCDDRFSGYLLALAARAAEKQLQEQAMAAYVNDDFHEPPEHYANDRESDDSDSDVLELNLTTRGGNSTMRRESIDDVSWEVKEMRKYHAQLNRHNDKQIANDIDRSRKISIKDEWAAIARQVGGATDASGGPKDIIGGWQKGVGLRPMRDAASPPMLGGDIEFRLCYSPQPTSSEFDEPQGTNVVSQRHHSGGLWMGLCSTKTRKNEEREQGARQFAVIDEVLINGSPKETDKQTDIEEAIDRECTDEFVTQVYNYLSLGYPCLARKFDGELSNVSGVSLEEIRSADSLADAKGYVGLGEGVGVAMSGVTDGKCGRWKALRAYIREWAKQSPGMEHGGVGLDAWGVRARKGSWAI